MANMPSYVRLAPRLTKGMVADLESGWTIGGLDVRRTPEKQKAPGAYKFVRKALADGRLEAASQAEWEEVHDTEEIEGEALVGRPRATTLNSQEAHVQRAAAEGRQRIEASRRAASSDSEDSDDSSDDDDEDDDGLDELSKAQLVDRARSLGLDTNGNKETLKERLRSFANGDDEDDEDEDESTEE
jgi:hypothetical protein